LEKLQKISSQILKEKMFATFLPTISTPKIKENIVIRLEQQMLSRKEHEKMGE